MKTKGGKQPVWIMRFWVAFLLLLFPPLTIAETVFTESSDQIERIVWHKTPIAVTLQVGEERLVHFPDSVSVGIPPSLATVLRSQSINGTLYLLAHAPFEATRVVVRAENAGPIFVLDIAAQLPAPERPVLPDMQVLVSRSEQPRSEEEGKPRPVPSWGYVALTRYAAQQLFAPSRLLPPAPGIVRVPIGQDPVALVRGGQVEAIPVAAWRAGLQYVTAVKLINKTQQPVVLDPRQLRGRWLAATFQHNRLLPSGHEADASALYLVSDRPFATSL